MKRRFWTNKEIKFIEQSINSISVENISRMLDRSKSSVYHKMRSLKMRPPSIWSELDDLFLKANYTNMRNKDISKILNRSISGVESRASKLGVNHKNFYPPEKYCIDCGSQFTNKHTRSTRCAKCAWKNRRGENNPMWNGGLKSFSSYVSSYLRPWRKKVLERDEYCCQICNEIERLEVHHKRTLKSICKLVVDRNLHLDISDYINKRQLAKKIVKEHKVKDGITLCYSCHKKIHYEKLGELLGTPNERDEGNQQPSASNVIKIVDAKVQRLTGEDLQPIIPTRAPNTQHIA